MNQIASRHSPPLFSQAERWAFVFLVISGVFFITRNLVIGKIYFDAQSYYMLGLYVTQEGAWGYHHFLRTYGTPLFLSSFVNLGYALPLPKRILDGYLDITLWPVVLVSQACLYVLALLALRYAIALFSEPLARMVFIGLCLNVYTTSMMAEVLSEAPSLILYALMAGIWLELMHSLPCRSTPPGMIRLERQYFLYAALLGFLVGFSAMVRPANYTFVVPLLCVFAGCQLFLMRVHGGSRSSAFVVVIFSAGILGGGAAILPQLFINWIYFDMFSISSAENNLWWAQSPGVERMKFQSTFSHSSLIAPNPFFAGTAFDHGKPLQWYADYPLYGLFLLLIKFFNILDHDYFFTYTYHLHNWWRVPMSIVNHAFVGMGLMGLWFWFRRSWKNIFYIDGLSLWMLLVTLGSYSALSITTVGDMRYGILLLMAAFPLACHAWVETLKAPAHIMRRRSIGLGIYISAALLLSEWVRYHTPQIRSNFGPLFEILGIGLL